jgi:SAM-dependent methyltransferase
VQQLLDELNIGSGTRVLDVGCGRGEVVFNAAQREAVAVGIDYADAALRLAGSMRREHLDLAPRAAFVRCDVKAIPLRRASFDVAFMLDVVEHLHPWELDIALRNVRDLLAAGGCLCIHTMPNRNYYRWVYPVLRRVARVVQRKHVAPDPRSAYEYEMHVNEQTPGTLRRALEQAGYTARLWVDGFEKWPLEDGPLDYAVRVAAKRPPLRRLAAFHVFAIATPRGGE